jgi:hypothetical protein
MKMIKKLTFYTAITIILLILIGVAYVTQYLPNVGPPENIQVALTPKRVAQGRYLFNNVMICGDCHSRHDWSKPIGPTSPENYAVGGDIFDAGDGFPGKIQAPNITPFNLKNWTDGEIFRALTTGVRKDGSAMFSLMPWPNYAQMDREDLYAVIAYLRTIPGVATPQYLKRQLDFPDNILVNTKPQKARLGHIPPISDTVAYGAYLINIAGCNGCHSMRKHGIDIPGLQYAGGMAFNLGNQTQYAANITPDKATGIGNWTSATFIQFFKSHTDSARKANPKATIAPSAMPTYDYSEMKVSDLRAIFAYLKSIKPVNHRINNL